MTIIYVALRKLNSTEDGYLFSKYIILSFKTNIPLLILSRGNQDMVNRYINCNGKYFANVKNLYITYVFLKCIFFFWHNLNIYLKINNFLLINNCHMYRSHVLNNYIRKFVTFDYSLWNDP